MEEFQANKPVKSKSTLVEVWNNISLLEEVSGILLPMMFVFWYATTYLTHTFENDPFEVSVFTLIIKSLQI